MRVEEICTRSIRSCGKDTPLASAGNLMWEADCGILPVVDDAGKVIGVVTDRDICLALSLIDQPACDVPVRAILRPTLHTCRLGDGVRDALRAMRIHKVRRLAVVDGAGVLQGMLSLSDVARAAKPERLADPSDVTDEDLALALKTLWSRVPPEGRVPAPQTTAFV